jgi:hypothetical protein
MLPENTNLIIMVIDELPTVEAATQKTETSKRAKAIDSLKGIIPPDFKFNLDDIRRERIEKRGLVE